MAEQETDIAPIVFVPGALLLAVLSAVVGALTGHTYFVFAGPGLCIAAVFLFFATEPPGRSTTTTPWARPIVTGAVLLVALVLAWFATAHSHL